MCIVPSPLQQLLGGYSFFRRLSDEISNTVPQTRQTNPLSVETLEGKRLLAGDLACAASYNAGDDDASAYVVGDANRDGTYDPSDVQSVPGQENTKADSLRYGAKGTGTATSHLIKMTSTLRCRAGPTGFQFLRDSKPRESSWAKDRISMLVPSPIQVLTHAGSIYKGNLCTGEGQLLVEATGRLISGLSYDAQTLIMCRHKVSRIFDGNFTEPRSRHLRWNHWGIGRGNHLR